jgi:hypothetical protein
MLMGLVLPSPKPCRARANTTGRDGGPDPSTISTGTDRASGVFFMLGFVPPYGPGPSSHI